VGYWNIMRYFPQNWLVVSNLYDIAKLLWLMLAIKL
jgi:hypothetical protein